jgi:hypothetical protein
MDLLYVVATSSAWNHNELRYSLRSVCENMPHDRVVITGYKPPWVKGVSHVPGNDTHQLRQVNIQSKLLRALKSGKVGPLFCLMCDDLYILQPWTCNAIRYCGKLRSRVERIKRLRSKGDQWRRDLENTVALLSDMGLSDPLDFGTHHPVVLDRDKFIEALELCARMPSPVDSVAVYVAMHGAEVVASRNSKVMKWKAPPISAVLSTSPDAEKSIGFQRWIASRFPTRCRYEGRL